MMPDEFPFAGRAARAIVLGATLVGLVACAPPIRLDVAPPPAAPVVSPSANVVDDATAVEPPTVVVRYYSFSPTVSVLGWDAATAGYGLRSTVRRDGSLVRDHLLYVSMYYFADYRNFMRANWHAFTQSTELARPLEFTGIFSDVQSCEGNRDGACSPYVALRVRIPDAFLRASRDDVVVKVYGRYGSDEILVLRRDMIDAYIKRVDLVSSALQTQSRAIGSR